MERQHLRQKNQLIMKATKILFSILIALSLLACDRNKPKPKYHYVEPEENIAEIIWTHLQAQHPKVKPAFEAALKMEQQGYMAEKEAFRPSSKTHLEYLYYTELGEYPMEEYNSPLYAHYQLYCYQTLDDSWIGVIIESIGGTEIRKDIEENPEIDLFIVEYKNDTIIDRDISTLGPESFKVATSVSKYHYDENLVFDSVSVGFLTYDFWPMKFNWNGKKFEQDPETVFMERAIDYSRGLLHTHDAGPYFFDMDNRNATEYLIIDDDTLAHFTYKENSRLAEYTVKSPRFGFAQTMGHINQNVTVISKPVAVGYPIKNVLDYEKKDYLLKDTTIVAGYKDGKYVITQQLARQGDDHPNIFIEFVAKDENANIEYIRVYGKEVFQYVEPKENIAEIIWNCLKTKHPEVKPAYDAAKSLEEYGYDNEEDVTEFLSKTHMKYEYIIPRGSEEYDDMLVAIYELQCYQTLNDSWMGIVKKHVNGYQLNQQDCNSKVFAVEYRDGILTDRDVNALFPESSQLAEQYYSFPSFITDNEGLLFQSSNYWPVRLLWNGKTFEQDPKSVILTCDIHKFYGWFDRECFVKLGEVAENLDANNDCVEDGEVLAHFDVQDGIVVGYTVKSPKCGFAQTENGYSITSKPIAIGFPISNVIDYEGYTHDKDNTIVTGHRDGKYVITQQLNHDKNIRRDIFIEFIADDEQSDIESIRVYTKEFVMTLQTELDDSSISKKTKSLFSALNIDTNGPDFGAFQSVSGFDNGFSIYFKGKVNEMRFQTYEVNDGSTLIFLAKYQDNEKMPEVRSWFYQDNSFEEVELPLPSPEPEDFRAWSLYGDDITPEDYLLTFTNDGLKYYGNTEFADDASNRVNPAFYEVRYRWVGDAFEMTEEDF